MKKKLGKSNNPNTKEFWEQNYKRHIHEKKLRYDDKGLLKLKHLFEAAGSILDFGSGLGGTVKFLASRSENKNYTLVDHSGISMQYAKDEVLGSEDARGNSMFRIMTKYDELVHILPRSHSKKTGKPTTAYFYVTKP